MGRCRSTNSHLNDRNNPAHDGTYACLVEACRLPDRGGQGMAVVTAALGLPALLRLGVVTRPLRKIERRVTVTGKGDTDSGLVNPKVNIRVLLAVFWICHFILWIFGDMLTLMQEMGEPATDSLILFVAPTTAIVLTLMVVFSLVGPPTYVRLANLIVAPVYLLFNVVFFVDATQGWEYYLGVFYVLFNVLIIWRAYTWPKVEQG